MSYIDTFDHEFVAFFAGIPLYHPLEVATGTDVPGEFGCSPTQLVLGGGDGEHPALVLTDPSAAVMYFLRFWLGITPGAQESVSSTSVEKLTNVPSPWSCLHYAGWDLEAYVAFHARCTAAAFPTPFSRNKFDSLEDWLISSLGEFVRLSMPELSGAALQSVPDVYARVDTPLLFNVMIVPPGYHIFAGRRRNASGDVVWGNYRWVTRARSQEA